MSLSRGTVNNQLGRRSILRIVALCVLGLGLVGCCKPLVEGDELCVYVIPQITPIAEAEHPAPSANVPTPPEPFVPTPEREFSFH